MGEEKNTAMSKNVNTPFNKKGFLIERGILSLYSIGTRTRNLVSLKFENIFLENRKMQNVNSRKYKV